MRRFLLLTAILLACPAAADDAQQKEAEIALKMLAIEHAAAIQRGEEDRLTAAFESCGPSSPTTGETDWVAAYDCVRAALARAKD